MKRTLGELLLGVLLVSISSSSARAGEDERRARIARDEAERAAKPSADLSCSIGQQYEALAAEGDPRDHQLALLHYQRCLREGGPSTGRADIEARIARLLGSRPDPMPKPSAGAAPAPLAVPVWITSYKPEAAYKVTLAPEGVTPIPCTTPCIVTLPPGTAQLHAEGAGKIDLDVQVPPWPGAIRVQHREYGPMAIAGIAMISTGFLMATTMWTLAFTCDHIKCSTAHLVTWPVVGTSTFVAGIALLARGRRLPDDANRVILRGNASLLDRATFGISPLPGGAGAGMGVRF